MSTQIVVVVDVSVLEVSMLRPPPQAQHASLAVLPNDSYFSPAEAQRPSFSYTSQVQMGPSLSYHMVAL
jgi:hypothetical protein